MEIPRLNLDEFLEDNRGCKFLKRCKDTMIIQLSNGELLKILDDELLEITPQNIRIRKADLTRVRFN